MNRNAFEELAMPRQQKFRFRCRYVMYIESKSCLFCSCDIWLLMFKIRRGNQAIGNIDLFNVELPRFLHKVKINCAVKMHNK